ncbi:uncharacterized protein LOC108669101 [Hyalella azteca]|uniref:Uncharacterized protein LOC108669101 n=1 Tax=Hyalella azteca TaxID=294128 RepID=A0A8B7NEI1_HYAAZ|nr:uncharacterized protein LOC108669101 [Hyalella azteca]
MAIFQTCLPKIFGIVSGRIGPVLPVPKSHLLNPVRYKVVRRNKTPPTPKPFDKYIVPRFVPSKFRVRPSRYAKFEYKPQANKGVDQALWSSGECSHPLPDDPLIDYPQKLPDGGLRYYGFDYYPADPDNVETLPKEEISPLFMVRRARFGIRMEWWYREILEELGLINRFSCGDVVIVKNVPEMNEKLYSVKHLIEIKPVKIPANLPLDADPTHCRFTEDAELLYSPEYAVQPEQLEEPKELVDVKLDRPLITREGRKRWDSAWDLKT